MFKVGDELVYNGGYPEGSLQRDQEEAKYRCIVVEIGIDGLPKVQFFATAFCPGYQEGKSFGIWSSFPISYYRLVGPFLSKEEKVINKIKLLEKKFKDKTLPKVKVRALALP